MIGYNIIQSKIAIGSGGLTGMGYLNGNQTQLGYLYPKTTDFIFSVISEEFGFVVSASIVLLYIYFINKAIFIAKTARDMKGTLLASGIVRYIHISYCREYRNGYGIITDNRSTITLCELWRKLSYDKLYLCRYTS